ncbi:MAG: hypothetical protein HQK53_10770 [Oligoflexia bacterium]|nr:hypothetical protein [Oligoflexia bacterium]
MTAELFAKVKHHLEQALTESTKNEGYTHLLKAKEEYFSLTGGIHEESDEYEHKMNCFNDWFLLHYSVEKSRPPIIIEYLLHHKLNDDVKDIFTTPNYSLFEYKKINSKKQVVLKDILHNKNLVLIEMMIGLVEKDFFVGRTLTIKDQNYLMRGICVLPPEVKSICSKYCKRIRKLNNPTEEEQFLLTLEFLKTKWLRYGKNMDAKKIFIF